MAIGRPIEIEVSRQGQFSRVHDYTQTARAERDGDDLTLVGHGNLELLRVKLSDIEEVVHRFRGEQILEAQAASGWDCDDLGHVFTVGVERCTMCKTRADG